MDCNNNTRRRYTDSTCIVLLLVAGAWSPSILVVSLRLVDEMKGKERPYVVDEGY